MVAPDGGRVETELGISRGQLLAKTIARETTVVINRDHPVSPCSLVSRRKTRPLTLKEIDRVTAKGGAAIGQRGVEVKENGKR